MLPKWYRAMGLSPIGCVVRFTFATASHGLFNPLATNIYLFYTHFSYLVFLRDFSFRSKFTESNRSAPHIWGCAFRYTNISKSLPPLGHSVRESVTKVVLVAYLNMALYSLLNHFNHFVLSIVIRSFIHDKLSNLRINISFTLHKSVSPF